MVRVRLWFSGELAFSIFLLAGKEPDSRLHMSQALIKDIVSKGQRRNKRQGADLGVVWPDDQHLQDWMNDIKAVSVEYSSRVERRTYFSMG